MATNNEKTIDMIKFEVPYFQAPNTIFGLKLDIKANSKLVYLYLCRCGNNGADAFPSYNMIAEVCGIGKRTAIECVKELVDVNLLYKQSRKNEKGESISNLYIVNIPEKATCNRLSSQQIKDKKKTRKKSSATDAPLKNENLGSATDALGSATDALCDATDAPYKELLDKEPNTNNYSISSSSKGNTPDSIYSLIDLFDNSICKLKKTTTVKFMNYIEKYNEDFIKAIIAYCEERNAKSFSYFQKTIDRYISEDITTVDALNSSIENFKDENKTKKNNALKAKDEARKEKEFEDTINENILEDMINDKNTAEEAHNKINAGENVNELKELLKKDMTDIQFKTWIAGLDFKLNANELFIVCPNAFTKDILVKRYEYIIKNAVKQAGLNVEIEYVVAE